MVVVGLPFLSRGARVGRRMGVLQRIRLGSTTSSDLGGDGGRTVAGSGGARCDGGDCAWWPQVAVLRPPVVGTTQWEHADDDGAVVGGLSGRSGGYARWPQAVVWWPPIAGFRWAMVQRRGAAWEVGRPQQLLVPPPIPPPRCTRYLCSRDGRAAEVAAHSSFKQRCGGLQWRGRRSGQWSGGGGLPGRMGGLGSSPSPSPLAHGSVVGCARRLWRYGGQVVE
jgi:hypothetical protein